MLFRSLNIDNYKSILKAYICYVRPILEFNSSMWNPNKIYIYRGINKHIEKGQRAFSKKKLYYRCTLLIAD